MYDDHEFDPVSPEEKAEREREDKLARRIRQEVLRVQRGEAEEDLRADEEQVAEEKAEAEQAQRKAERREGSLLRQLFTGKILIHKGVSEYYRYMLVIAGMFFMSIMVMFWTLHLDVRYSRLEREVQMLRDRSIRLQEQRYRQTTHSAIVERLRERGIELYDPLAPSELIED